MPVNFPLIGPSQQYGSMYPLQGKISVDTDIVDFTNGSERRSLRQSPRTTITLTLKGVGVIDKNAIDAFFQSTNGSINANPWNIVPQRTPVSSFGITNTFMVPTQNRIEWVQEAQNQYSCRISAREDASNYSNLGDPSAFPTFANGKVQQYPVTRGIRNRGYISRMPNGPTYVFPMWDGSSPGFPGRMLRYWRWDPTLANTDFSTLRAHFLQARGRWFHFSFTDPFDNITYTRCRYSSDDFEYTHIDINQIRVKISLQEDYPAS